MALLFALGLALSILLDLKESVSFEVYHSLEAAGWILTFSFAFLWFRNRIMGLALLVISIFGNLQFWSVPIFGIHGHQLSFEMMQLLTPAVYLFGLGCLTMAQWPQFYPVRLVRTLNWPLWKIAGSLIILSLVLQILGRIPL